MVRGEAADLPELLIASTVRAALKIGRDRLPAALVVSRQAAALVNDALSALAGTRSDLLVALFLTAEALACV